MILFAYITFIGISFYWRLRIFSAGQSRKDSAIGLFAIYSAAPILLYGTIFFLLIGIEELAGIAIIDEGYARSLPLIIAGGTVVVLLATVVFSLVVIFLKRSDVKAT